MKPLSDGVTTRVGTSMKSHGMGDVLGNRVPVWLFLLCVLLGIVFTIFFGWFVMYTVGGSNRFGQLGKASVVVASFPDLVATAYRDGTRPPETRFRVPRTSADLSDFHAVRVRTNAHVQGLMIRADEAALARAPGWRILVGSFMIDGELVQAALALSPELEVVRVWEFRDEVVPGRKPQSTARLAIEGFAMLKDGSMIVTFLLGNSIQRFDRCGRRIWGRGGTFDHTVMLDEDEKSVWTVSSDHVLWGELVQVTVANGEVIRRISMDDIVAANPTIDVFEIIQLDQDPDTNSRSPTDVLWLPDPFHLNEIEPLPAAIADRFPGFEAGDLLVSARQLNLIFVMDPETLKVKWWHSGDWRRQHDPDWQLAGLITVYDNRMGRDYSRIVSIDPASKDTRVLFNGRTDDFYSRTRGKHQITKDGSILISSPIQGRAFEVGPDGSIVFDIFNTKPGSTEFNYYVSDLIWFPIEAFNFSRDFSCAD